MDLPHILAAKRTTLALAPPPLRRRSGRAGVAFAEPEGLSDQFIENHVFKKYAQMQILSLWCWNAVGAAVASYYLEMAGRKPQIPRFKHQCQNLTHNPPGKDACCDLDVPPHGLMSEFTPWMDSFSPLGRTYNDSDVNFVGNPQWITAQTGIIAADRVDFPSGSRAQLDHLARVVQAIHRGNIVVAQISGGRTDHVVSICGTRAVGDTRIFLVADPMRGFVEWFDGPLDGWSWTQSIFFSPA